MLSSFFGNVSSVLRNWLGRSLAISSRVSDDDPGWGRLSGGPHDRDSSEILKLYQDALLAWRKNPIAKRIIDVITDYCIGDGIFPAASGEMGKFTKKWWDHDMNRWPQRLPDIVDELSRAGDLFITLHTNEVDGMSYVRVIPKDLITAINVAPNDWEREMSYEEMQAGQVEPRIWLNPTNPEADDAPAVMLHYSINRPVGALYGEGDLATMLPWLLRYSRMLEDRVRLHWALKAFLWVVTVPANLVTPKRAQYAVPPDSGSIIVKDEKETWEAVTPTVHGGDASHDLHAVRMMIDAGSGIPPHWRGEPTDVNLATARAMADPAVRRLRRRQETIVYILTDLAFHSYRRAWLRGKVRGVPDRSKIKVQLPDISVDDNTQVAQAARQLSQALETLRKALPGQSKSYLERMVSLIFRAAGEPLEPDDVNLIVQEAMANPTKPAAKPAGSGSGLSANGQKEVSIVAPN